MRVDGRGGDQLLDVLAEGLLEEVDAHAAAFGAEGLPNARAPDQSRRLAPELRLEGVAQVEAVGGDAVFFGRERGAERGLGHAGDRGGDRRHRAHGHPGQPLHAGPAEQLRAQRGNAEDQDLAHVRASRRPPRSHRPAPRTAGCSPRLWACIGWCGPRHP